MSLLSSSVRVKRSLAPRGESPLTILHAEEESVEVNVAWNPRMDEMFFRELKEKERELIYQKVILEGCKKEMALLKIKLAGEKDPESKEAMMGTARRFAVAFDGKREQFLQSYNQWRSAMLTLDQSLLREAKVES